MCISSWLGQTEQYWDVIIADNSWPSTVNQEAIHRLLAIVKRHGHSVRLIIGCGGGIPQTYQAMMEASETELNVRMEDDVWMLPEMLGHLRDAIESDPKIAAAAPMTPNWKHSTVVASAEAPNGLENGFIKTSSSLAPELGQIWEAVDGQQVIANSDGKIYNVSVIHAGSLYRKSALEAIGGFATHFSPVGHREESMTYSKLYLAGYRLVVVGSARLWHFEANMGGSRERGAKDPIRDNHRMADEALFQREIRALAAKHPDRPLKFLKSAPINS